MKRVIKFIGQALLFLWQLPQHIIGLAIYLVYAFGWRREFVMYKEHPVFIFPKIAGGVSLGWFVFIGKFEPPGGWDTVRHELGHSLQSLILGPFYLLVIGLPSLIHSWLYGLKKGQKRDYYAFYTERWADKLGGVER